MGSSSGEGAAWTSPDGVTWTAHGIPGATELRRVATGPDRTVAVGGDQIWISPDGGSWTPAPHGPAQGSDLVDVTYGNGTFIAIGRAGQGSTSATLWTSIDGDSWTRLPDSPNLANFCPRAVAAGAFAVVLVGDDCATSPPHAVVASSADLSHWTRQVGDPPTYQARSLAAVTASDRRFIAGGAVDTPGGPGQAFYSSDDGVTWHRHGTFRPPGATEFDPGCHPARQRIHRRRPARSAGRRPADDLDLCGRIDLGARRSAPGPIVRGQGAAHRHRRGSQRKPGRRCRHLHQRTQRDERHLVGRGASALIDEDRRFLARPDS